ncbi:MAG: tetratricopeptide repeat protein [Gemmatimonadales bacterium]|jgi:tetratricopeptide (TPR) repeat protein|nr:tetratricopeptide repeat protein [Gemmatimonadales bacterium]MBT3498503.1 tetratricopeptide repeat protein [Gemmatimonadales bacterium]MBT3776350.1 tetratricopeptide repeat protein [Gemmatimonadales bacterium]MBT3958892.1 tetratricopeptide repeat protein [Gemmatimonadales bacterium]MBT4189389.1 tetratricopeptide repeat protein [Gemmatimonadales bacterium]
MSKPESPAIARVGLSVALVVGMAISGLLFLRARPTVATPEPVALAAAQAQAAHESAGVDLGADRRDVNAVLSARVAALEARVAEAPEEPALLAELARLLHDGHREEQAIAWYQRAMTADPSDTSLLFDLAAVHVGLGDWESAASILEARLASVREDATTLYNLGAVRANQGRTADAIRHFEAAGEATTDPDLGARVANALARLRGA